MTKSLVTIFTPYFNSIQFLEASLHSYLKQTYRPLELYLVLDFPFSLEERKILENFKLNNQNEDFKITVIFNQRNIGPNNVFYQNYKNFNGKYILLPSQNDILTNENFINEAVLNLEEDENNLIFYSNCFLEEKNDYYINDRVIKQKKKVRINLNKFAQYYKFINLSIHYPSTIFNFEKIKPEIKKFYNETFCNIQNCYIEPFEKFVLLLANQKNSKIIITTKSYSKILRDKNRVSAPKSIRHGKTENFNFYNKYHNKSFFLSMLVLCDNYKRLRLTILKILLLSPKYLTPNIYWDLHKTFKYKFFYLLINFNSLIFFYILRISGKKLITKIIKKINIFFFQKTFN